MLLGSDVLARGNKLNAGNGIRVEGTHNTIEGNTCTNSGSCVTIPAGTGNLVVGNHSIGNFTDYLIGPGNSVGPFSSDPATAGPWANFIVD